MKRALLSMAAAAVLAVAVPTLADAQHRGGAVGGGGGASFGGAAHFSGGGGAAIGGGGGRFSAAPSGGNFARTAPSRSFAVAPDGGRRFVQGGATVGGQRFVQGNVQGNRIVRRDFDGRRHFRRGFVFLGVPYDDSYYDYAYADSCYQLRLIDGFWQRVWVCDSDAY
jgi:hypothetical protein